jgi:hypothetical protein
MGLQMAATLEVPGTERKSDREPTAVIGQLTKQRCFSLIRAMKQAKLQGDGE